MAERLLSAVVGLLLLASTAHARGLRLWLVRVDLKTFTAKPMVDFGSARWHDPGCADAFGRGPNVEIGRNRHMTIPGVSDRAQVVGCSSAAGLVLLLVEDGTAQRLLGVDLAGNKIRW